MNQRRVVITGMGAVTPLGKDRESTWARVLRNDCAAAPIEQFDARDWPTTFACEVHDFTLSPDAVRPEHTQFLIRPTEFGMAAALEAIQDSGVLPHVDPERFGISVGAGIGAIRPHELARMLEGQDISGSIQDLGRAIEHSRHPLDVVFKNHPGTMLALLSARWGCLGTGSTIHTACASSGQSLGQAYLQIKRGEADVMLAGGADSLAGELLLAGFCLLGALSRRNDDPQRGSRPFDHDRDGFVAGEGAAMLILEEYGAAKARGARIYAEICGFGETESAYRITDLPPDGRGIGEAMEIAVKDAGVEFSAVDYINAHGTSTELNDRVEALAVKRVFGERGARPVVSSTKSHVGHLISAAGALELMFCVLAIRDGVIPPNRNLHKPDHVGEVTFSGAEAMRRPVKVAMSNSVGFGGSNSAVIVKECV